MNEFLRPDEDTNGAPLDQHWRVIELLRSRLAEARKELSAIDERFARRPALADCKTRAARVELACAMAGRAEAAEQELTELKERERWIPVSERLAPPHETVEALCSNGDRYQVRVCYGMHEPFWCGHSTLNFGVVLGDKGCNVTHWRPLPTPPVQEAENGKR